MARITAAYSPSLPIVLQLIGLFLSFAAVGCSQSTTLVTATTTVTATEGGDGACDHFYGACVVYGSAAGAPSTTTHLTSISPSTAVAPTATTTTVYILVNQIQSAAASACQDVVGACVVYATDAQGTPQYTTTFYQASSSSRGISGIVEGFTISGGGNYIEMAIAPRLSLWTGVSIFCVGVVNLGFAIWL